MRGGVEVKTWPSWPTSTRRDSSSRCIFAKGSLLEPGDDVIMVMPHSKVQSLVALKGHMLGVNTTANIGYLLVASVLAQNGLAMKATPGSSCSAVNLPTEPNFPFPAPQPLVSGKVTAAIMSEPFATQLAEQTGASIIADTDSGSTFDQVTAAAMALSNYPLGITPVRLQRVANVMKQFGFLNKPFDMQQLLN